MTRYRTSLEAEIRAKAYEIFEGSGRVEGRDLDNWIEAEQSVSSGHEARMSPEEHDEAFSGMPFEA